MRRPNLVLILILALLFATTQSATPTNQTHSHSTIIDSTLAENQSQASALTSPENSSEATSENITENSTESKLLNYSANHTAEARGVLLGGETQVDSSLETLYELTTTDHASINITSTVQPKQTSYPHNFSAVPSTQAPDWNNASDANPETVEFKSGINHEVDLILEGSLEDNSATETNSSDFGEITTGDSLTTVEFQSGFDVLPDSSNENSDELKNSTDVNFETASSSSETATFEIDTNDTGLFVAVNKASSDVAGTISANLSDVAQNDDTRDSHTFTEVEQSTTNGGDQETKITGEAKNAIRSPYNRSTVDLLYEISLNRTRGSSGGAKHFGTVLKRPEDRNNRHVSGLFASRSHTEAAADVETKDSASPTNDSQSQVKDVVEIGSGLSGQGGTSESWEDVDKDVVNSEEGGTHEGNVKEAGKEQQKSVFTMGISGTSHMGVDKDVTARATSVLPLLKSDNRLETDEESHVTVSQSMVEEEKRIYSVANMENRAESELKRVNSSDKKVAMDDGDHIPWPVKREAVMEGDLVLGGLMMVHEREDTVTCGPVMPQGGVQAVETMLYTLDVINSRAILPGVKLGAHVLDDCDKDTYGLEMAVDFIKGSISNIDDGEYHCNKTQVRKVISGVVGAASSVTSIQVANLLRLFRIPQVSFFSTSPELSNKQRFEFFTRTIPSDHYQVKAMVEIVLRMSWSYVSIIYEESNYGIKAFEELETLLGKHEVCIAVKEKLVKDSGVAEETAYDNIVLKLLTKPRARGVIIFGSDQEVAGVMRAVRRTNATGSFSWIGSDGWSARSLVSDGNEAEVEGTLSVQPQANPVKGFQEYFLGLTVENNRRNPWFVEFWEDHFHCRYPNSSRTPYNQKYTSACTTKEQLTLNDTAFEDQLQFVSDAVLAFGYALKAMHQDLCQGLPGLCDAMKPTKGTDLLRYLRKVEFEGLSGDMFRFDRSGDGPARYNIIHFKQVSPGQYQWIRVGEYLDGELRLNMSEVQFRLGHPAAPESVCSLPCHQGQAKKYVEGESCCWHCFNCTQYQIRHPRDETQCIPCRDGTLPDAGRVRCEDIPEVFLRTESGWAIGAMSLSASGILVTLFVCAVFARHHDSPVVRASGRELSYVLLTGILLCYSVTFLLVLRPSDLVCGVQRFSTGFCFTVVYASLLTKTNRIARIFNAGKRTAKRPSFISPRSQLLICAALVFVQVLINGAWMLVSPPRAIHHYPTREDNHLVCSSHIDASYMIAFTYPILLIVVCTLYAVLTRKIPEAFNESKHIGFTMYTTCVIWLAFVPLYFGTGNHVPLRITSMSVTISLSASVTLVCLFSPKLYIILIRPERNVRQSMMPSKVRFGPVKGVGAVTGTTQSGSMMAAVVTAAATNQHALCPPGMLISASSGDTKQSLGVDVEMRQDPLHQLSKRNGVTAASVDRYTQTPTPEENGLATPATNATPL